MRKYQTPNPEDCVVSPGAKQMIDGTTDIISHLRYTLEEAKRLKVSPDVISKLEALIDLNSDLVALICQIDQIQDGNGLQEKLREATAAAMGKHFMDHMMGEDVAASPARVNPKQAEAGGRGPRDHGRPDFDEDVL